MNRNNLAVALLLAVAPAVIATPNARQFIEAQIKALGLRYNQVEEQLPRSVRYTQTQKDGDATVTKQAWLDGAGDPIKVTIERTEGAARELSERVALNPDEPYNGLFIVDRKESPLPDGIEVAESRRYFGSGASGSNGDLLRELRKTARFKNGEPLDLSRVPNLTMPAERPVTVTTPEQMKARDDIFEAAQTIAKELMKAGPPATDPFANIKGDSDNYRPIEGTASPDGRYIIALGFAREGVDWDALLDEHSPEAPKTYSAEDDEDIRNYVVDVAQKKILGETGCAYFGTRRRYNHRTCSVIWSPNSRNFAQLWNDKWWSNALVAGIISPQTQAVSCIDLSKTVDRKAFAFVKKHYDPKNGGALSYSLSRIGNDGIIELGASENIASGDRKGEVEFAVDERLQLRAAANGIRAEVLNIKRAPKEE